MQRYLHQYVLALVLGSLGTQGKVGGGVLGARREERSYQGLRRSVPGRVQGQQGARVAPRTESGTSGRTQRRGLGQ